MKYGETLRRRSIAAWAHHNIDYDDIKHIIKEETTPGKGKTVAVPGRSDDKRADFENRLFATLVDQHHRIDLFVRSKTGEIRRRLEHAQKQLRQLSARTKSTADRRVPVSRLERYGRLENDVLKAGDEIRSLARFTGTQRTAFRKLLKKYKKWTGSAQLEDRFREEVLDDPKSFTNLDLGPLLDEYSTTLQQIRTLYEARIRQTSGDVSPAVSIASVPVLSQLQTSLDTGSLVAFDTAITTVPLGEDATFASYFVHPENIVELQILILQHARYYASRSRNNSLTPSISASAQKEVVLHAPSEGADYFAIEADDAEQFAKDQGSITVKDREHCAGSTPQKAKLCARWNASEDARVAWRTIKGRLTTADIKKKHVSGFFDKTTTFPSKSSTTNGIDQAAIAVRREFEADASLEPLYEFSSSRSRFIGTANDEQRMVLGTIDTGVSFRDAKVKDAPQSRFPFALLLVRQEGAQVGGLVSCLDESHLVERVRGFSFEYHAIYEISKSPSMPAPLWLAVLSRDIRKLPPAPLKRGPSAVDGSSGTLSAARASSSNSVQGVTDSATAVETSRSDSVTPGEELLQAPPIRSFRRKKRRRAHVPERAPTLEPRGWNEFDHPEDGEDGGEAYTVSFDPNEVNAFDRFFERVARVFKRRRSQTSEEREALLTRSPSSAGDDPSSSEDEENATVTRPKRGYGTLPRLSISGQHRASTSRSTVPATPRKPVLSALTSICLASSVAILVLAYVLATTGKRKLAKEVNAGIIFAVASSLILAIIGFASLLREQETVWTAWALAVVVLIVDAVGSGGLLAWMLG